MHLHIHSGDCAAQILENSGLGEPCAVWGDVLHIGALDWRWPDEVRYEVRAQVLSDTQYKNADVIAHLRKQDATVDTASQYDEVTIWVDACLYDQLILCFILNRIYERTPNLNLLCMSETPDHLKFSGYGELTQKQMLSLIPYRRPVTREQFVAACLAWHTVASPERSPQRLRAIANETDALPFLPAALERFAEEFSDAGGLNRTDRQILGILRDSPLSRIKLFAASNALEEFPFMGDATFFDRVDNLVKNGLVRVDGDIYSCPL